MLHDEGVLAGRTSRLDEVLRTDQAALAACGLAGFASLPMSTAHTDGRGEQIWLGWSTGGSSPWLPWQKARGQTRHVGVGGLHVKTGRARVVRLP